MSDEKHAVQQITEAVGGVVTKMGALPDGSGFAIVSMPLPKDHWIYGDPEKEKDGFEPPPMPFRMGLADGPRLNRTREMWAEALREAGKYAVRAATMKGKEMDFDPDALIQNLVVGMLGYWTPDGLDHADEWANPKREE
jgi:hypothetical protein